jgi:hypothetical protein
VIETTGDLITFALRTAGINGVGQTPLAEDSNTGLQLLSNLMAEWQRKRWLVWTLVDSSITSTGATSYTVGPTGDFAIARPDKLEAAYARLLPTGPGLSVDYPLALILAREDFSKLTLKTLTTFPSSVFYDSSFPTGLLYFWPVPPSGQFELHIVTKQGLPAYTTLTDDLALPPEYMSAALYSLAVELAMNYGLDPRPSIVMKMRAALQVVRTANIQPATLNMPSGVSGRYRGMGGLMVGPGLGSAFTLNGPSVLA